MIVLDTSVLSLVFRRPQRPDNGKPVAIALRRMIVDDLPLGVPGVVLQELLSGVRSEKQFTALQADLLGFSVLLADENQHIRAAEIVNTCRRTGIACSTVDALIAAQTVSAGGRLFTTDRDFEAIASRCPLQLYKADG